MQVEAIDQLVQPPHLGLPVGAAGTADDHQGGVLLGQVGQGADGDIGPLEGLDPPDEQEQRPVVAEIEAESEGGPGLGLVAGGEQAVVDAGGDDLDAFGDGVVEALELGRLVVGKGQDGIGAADDLGLGPGPQSVMVGVVLRLDPGQGVEGGHQGELELVLEDMARQSGQPVVGMDEVGPPDAFELDPDAGGEVVDQLDQVVDADGSVGAGVDVVDPEAGLDGHDRRQAVGPGAGVDVALDAGPGQGPAQLTDVDVHPPAVAGAGLSER